MVAVEVGVLVAIGGILAGLGALAPRRRRRADGLPASTTSRAAPPATAPVDAVLARLVRLAAEVTGTDRGALFVRAEQRVGGAVAVATVGQTGGMLGLAGVALRAGSATVVGEGRPAAAVPVLRQGHPVAALVVASDGRREDLDRADVDRLCDLAALCETALLHADLRGDAFDTSVAQARALETAAAVWDGSPRRSDQVARLAVEIGGRMGIAGADLSELELSGRLLDVGKLRVPGSVLRRRGPLTEDEWATVRMHPIWSAELISRVPGLEAVAGLVRMHHERADGHGYPGALPGDRVPLAARILAVCDAYTALRADRPYRAALSPAAAMAELRVSSGQFDAAVVDALAEHLAHAPTYA
jgi:hypothetical protein